MKGVYTILIVVMMILAMVLKWRSDITADTAIIVDAIMLLCMIQLKNK